MGDLTKYFKVMGLDNNATKQELNDRYYKLKAQFSKQTSSENVEVASKANQSIEKLENIYKILSEHISPQTPELTHKSNNESNGRPGPSLFFAPP